MHSCLSAVLLDGEPARDGTTGNCCGRFLGHSLHSVGIDMNFRAPQIKHRGRSSVGPGTESRGVSPAVVAIGCAIGSSNQWRRRSGPSHRRCAENLTARLWRDGPALWLVLARCLRRRCAIRLSTWSVSWTKALTLTWTASNMGGPIQGRVSKK